MISAVDRLRVTMEQMERVMRALDDLKREVLPRDPNLFAVMSEAPLEDLDRLRGAVTECVRELRGVAASP